MTTRAELEAVRFILDKEWPDGTTSDSVARAAIEALNSLRKTSQRPLGGPPHVGLAFKPHWSSKTHYVRWIGEERGKTLVWIVTADGDVGTLTRLMSPIWQYSTVVADSSRDVKQVDPVTGEYLLDAEGKIITAKGTTRNIKQVNPETGEHILDDKGKIVTKEKFYPAATTALYKNDLGLEAGEKLHSWSVGNFTVEEVFSHGALLRFQDGSIWGEDNHSLKTYYKDGWL